MRTRVCLGEFPPDADRSDRLTATAEAIGADYGLRLADRKAKFVL
jgi:hypothetical protein